MHGGDGSMNRYRIFIFAAATLSAALWAYACGDGTTEPPPPDPARPTTVTVSPATAELPALGATVQLSAEVQDQNGQVMSGAGVTWTSSSASMATVSSTGLVTAAGNGTATITATAGSASGTATVTVAQQVSAVVVSPAADTLVAGDTLRLTAEATDANGHAVAGAEFAWASGDTAVAVVDATGLVTGAGAGEVEITATTSGLTGRAMVVAAAPVPATVAITPDTVAVAALGDTVRLVAEVRDQLGRVMEREPVAWSSSDTLVATVDSAGLVTAAANGTATITAMARGASGTALVNVMQSAGSVTVSPSADTIALGDTLRLTAEAFDENGQLVAGAVFTWSSSNTSAATVEATGLVRGVGEGMATITATAGNALGTAQVTVENAGRAALVALYEATDGPNWVNNEGWLTNAPLGEWYGVGTDGFGRVLTLNLGGQWDSEREEWIPHGLQGSIPAELGSLSNLESLTLNNNALTGPIPTELGSLTALRYLLLGGNELTGPIPTELGNLSNLENLFLSSNALTGPIPRSLLQLVNLRLLYLERNEGLCAPGIASFADWLGAMEEFEGPFCNESDTGVLESLFEAVGGPGWTHAEGWLGGPVLAGWHGIRADSLGRVTALDLSRNGLAGRLPGNLSELGHMTELRIADNSGLSGRLPSSLATLSLQTFHYAGTGLCAPADASFREWLSAIPSHEGTGSECGPLSDREILEALYDATGGPNWVNNENWLTDAALGDWYGVRVDNQGRVTALDLDANDLVGPIVPELGSLTNLTRLDLRLNGLTGTIPPTLGNLSSLEYLRLNRSYLTGPIPPELGNLSSLEYLRLNGNELTGPIPPELGNLSSLEYLRLNGNQLTGPIPPGLGNLSSLEYLRLNGNWATSPAWSTCGSTVTN